MERFDFCSVMGIVWAHILGSRRNNQVDFCSALFKTYDIDAKSFDFSSSKCNRWLKGLAPIPKEMLDFYAEDGIYSLAMDIQNNILPALDDYEKMMEEVQTLFLLDPSISTAQKERYNEKRSAETEIDYFAELLYYSMNRPFLPRDKDGIKKIEQGNRSPVLADYVFGNEPPAPCPYFCGRKKELDLLHKTLTATRRAFVGGIPGIGKSELVKKYVEEYGNQYTNVLYIPYSGSLMSDIAAMDFCDNAETDERKRFSNHNQILRRLKKDSLLIIDNFDVSPLSDSVYSVILKYQCCVIFTTRCHFDSQKMLMIQELESEEDIFQMVTSLFKEAEKHKESIMDAVRLVHFHTLAVELIARILAHGILEPAQLVDKLKTNSLAIDSSDLIDTSKDGLPRRETFYGHIRTLFAIYALDEKYLEILRSLTIIPKSGIQQKFFARWINQPDLNAINEMRELGFVQTLCDYKIALHSMIREVTIIDSPPTNLNCQNLIESLRKCCMVRGSLPENGELLLSCLDQFVQVIKPENLSTYITMLEDAIGFVDEYSDGQRFQLFTEILENTLTQHQLVDTKDNAILLDFQAGWEGKYNKNPAKAHKIGRKALVIINKLPGEQASVAKLNVLNNLILWSTNSGDIASGLRYCKELDSLLDNPEIPVSSDLVTQVINLSTVRSCIGDRLGGLLSLETLKKRLEEENCTKTTMYARILEYMGMIKISVGRPDLAKEDWQNSYNLYMELYAGQPHLIQEVNDSFRDYLIQCGAKFVDPEQMADHGIVLHME